MALRRIKKAKITTIALCPKGKNRMPVLYKEDNSGAEGSVEFDTLVRKGTEEGEILAVVWVPDVPDQDGDFAEREVIKEFAHEYNRDHRHLDLRHDGKILTKEQAYVAESFIVAKGDVRFGDWKDYNGKPVNLEGAWATVIKIDDPVLRKEYSEGRWNGVSMSGPAVVEVVSSKSSGERAFEKMAEKIGQKEIEMNEEQMKALAKAITEGIGAQFQELAKELKGTPATEQKTEDKDPRPEPPMDVLNKEAREGYINALKAWELRKAMRDGTKTADEIARMVSELEQDEPSDEVAGIAKEDNSEVKALKRQLYKAQGRSRQPNKAEDSQILSKEETEAREEAAFAKQLAGIVNKARGIAS